MKAKYSEPLYAIGCMLIVLLLVHSCVNVALGPATEIEVVIQE